MVSVLCQDFCDAGLNACIQGRTGNDALEQGQIHTPRTRECDQYPAWIQQLEGQQIDVFVAARRTLDLGSGRSKFGRVEHNQIEFLPPVTEFAPRLEEVASDKG